jgi:hypothetical protein
LQNTTKSVSGLAISILIAQKSALPVGAVPVPILHAAKANAIEREGTGIAGITTTGADIAATAMASGIRFLPSALAQSLVVPPDVDRTLPASIHDMLGGVQADIGHIELPTTLELMNALAVAELGVV